VSTSCVQSGRPRIGAFRRPSVQMHSLMVKARVLEERLIQMYKQGDGLLWIGGPGEEAFTSRSDCSSIKAGPAIRLLPLPLPAVRTLLAMGTTRWTR